MSKFSTIDEYISAFESPQKETLQRVRSIISRSVPQETVETISYQIPTFRYHGNLIHFAGFKNHIGIYPGTDALEYFAEELKDFKTSKGTFQIPWNQEIPEKLIEKIVHFNTDLQRDKKGPEWHNYKSKWAEAEEVMQQVIVRTPLEKSFKWGMDVYTWQGKNVVSWSGFRDFFAIWFYNGVFLQDIEQVLVSASEGKTKSLRQWRFGSVKDLNPEKILSYITEAIQTVKDGKEILPEKMLPVHPEGIFLRHLENSPDLQLAFRKLTPGKQKEYTEYIRTARQEKTQINRLAKITPMILEGKGLNDRYRK